MICRTSLLACSLAPGPWAHRCCIARHVPIIVSLEQSAKVASLDVLAFEVTGRVECGTQRCEHEKLNAKHIMRGLSMRSALVEECTRRRIHLTHIIRIDGVRELLPTPLPPYPVCEDLCLRMSMENSPVKRKVSTWYLP